MYKQMKIQPQINMILLIINPKEEKEEQHQFRNAKLRQELDKKMSENRLWHYRLYTAHN